MSCGPGADQFIEDHFKDCVYNVRDYVGFCLGLAAIAFWVVAQIPQYYRNYKTKSAEALSPWFLAQWLLGDTFNLIGALLQGQQLPTTVYTAMYFVIADMFMMMQFIYYGALQRRREQVLKLQARRRHHRRHHHQHHSSSRSREQEALLGPQAAAGSAAGHVAGAQPIGGTGQQQQDLGQSSAWPAQQQERRRVPHQTAGQQQHLGSDQPVALGASPGLHEAAQRSSMDARPLVQHKQQVWRTEAVPASQSSDPDSCSDSDCSSASAHSSSKRMKGISRNGSPSRGPCDAAAAAATLPATSCAAAAAATPAFSFGAPVIRVPFGDLRWGGVRSVVAVAVLVCMGMVSLLPASTTRGMVPVSWSSGGSALQSPVQRGGSDAAAARAMQAGQQQQGSSIHSEPRPQLGRSHMTGNSDVGSIDSSSKHSWARQRRVSMPGAERDWSFIVGTGLGYVASVLYLCSRISQIHKNYSRKSSEGLALVMFIMAVCANLCTGTGILFRTFTLQELQEQLPWIIGSLGTISLDMIILWQSTVYGKDGHQQQQPGGGGEGAAGAHGGTRHHHHHHHHDGHEGQALLHHTAVDGAGDDSSQSAGGGRGQQGATSGAAVLDGIPLAPHHRGGLLGRRHAAAAAGGQVGPVDAAVVAPLSGASIQHV